MAHDTGSVIHPHFA